jgi:hypothetical protein
MTRACLISLASPIDTSAGYSNGAENAVRKWSPTDEMLQRLTIQKLHCEESLAFTFANLVNGADIRMVKCGSSLRVALEAFEGLVVSGYIVRQEFQGDKAMEVCVLGLVDDSHTAAELLEDSVVGNCPAEY